MHSASNKKEGASRIDTLAKRFPRLMAGRHLALPLAASLLTLASTAILLGPVLNRSGDNMYHLLNEYALARAFRAGGSLFGPLGLDFGLPVIGFYQPLFYLYNVTIHLVTGLDLTFVHNLTLVLCFALSPFSYFYFLKKLGLGHLAAGLGSLASMTSVAAFGNSFEAYHLTGIVTQSMGGLFFPWFMGAFVGLLNGENRAAPTALLFALAFLSHATMAVYAALAVALYIAVIRVDILKVWKRALLFGGIGVVLVAFWAVPFLEHTYGMRPVPDAVLRTGEIHWFNSVSKTELVMALTTGRLLDDARRVGRNRDKNDRLIDKIGITETRRVRPPTITILTALGILVAIFGIRKAALRFLLTGFCFSLILYTGPDDFPWLGYLPFMAQIQSFRAIYLVEFFAFGLVGAGLATVLSGIYHRATGPDRRPWRQPLLAVWLISAVCLVGYFCVEIVQLGRAHLRLRNPAYLDAMADAADSLPDRGRPFRVGPVYDGRYKIRQAWLGIRGFEPYCTHWMGIGPNAVFNLCNTLSASSKNNDLHDLVGVRYFAGRGSQIDRLAGAQDKDGQPLFERLASSKPTPDRAKIQHTVLDSGNDRFLEPLPGPPLPVVCSDAGWVWVADSWTRTYRRRLQDPDTPVPLRVDRGKLAESGLLDRAVAVLYAVDKPPTADIAALEGFVSRGGVLIAPSPIPGLKTRRPTQDNGVWDLIPRNGETPDPTGATATTEARLHPLEQGAATHQRFAFTLNRQTAAVAILPLVAVPGWQAFLDGAPLDIFPAGPDMLGLLLPAGQHELVVRWDLPARQASLLWLAALALAAILLVEVGRKVLGFRRRNKGWGPR
jgi:hypothetical protein